MDFLISASTDKGIVKSTNQDSCNMKLISTVLGRMAFAVLCDGMGGLAKGEVASSNVVRAFSDWAETRLRVLIGSGLSDDAIRREWTDIVLAYNDKIAAYGNANGIRLGTTITVILLTEERYYILNVGDTRCYEIAEDIRILTKDQTVVQREIDLGNLTPEEAETDPRRSVLLQCIGASESVYPDMFFGDTRRDAVYMLCSDGFRHVISKDEIWNAFHPSIMTDPEIMRQQSEYMIELDKSRGERDNITVLTIRTI